MLNQGRTMHYGPRESEWVHAFQPPRLLAWFVVVAVLLNVVPQTLQAASTEPIRNNAASSTQNPPDTANPIYYPISPTKSSDDVNVPPEEILRLFMERHTAMDYPAAAELAMRLIRIIPERPEGYYNLACVLARLRRSNEAIDALQQAIDRGWRDTTHISLDSDLNSIRHDQRFVRMQDDLAAKLEQEKIEPCSLRVAEREIDLNGFQTTVSDLLTQCQVPGAAVALVRDGEVVWSSNFGVRDRRSAEPLAASDRFRLRAPLHLLAIVAAGQQNAAGRLNLAKLLQDGVELDESVRRGAAEPVAAPGTVTTVRRSGSAERNTRRKACDDPRQPNYSGNGVYGLIRIATEMSSSTTFSEYCERAIFDPLGMNDTDFGASEPDSAKPLMAVGHSKLGSPMAPNPASDELARGGAVFTTAEDLAKLMCEIIQSEDTVDTLLGNDAVESDASRAQARKEEFGRKGDAGPGARVCSPALFTLVSRVNQETRRGLGLALDVRETQYGDRVQVADTVSGLGCLMRWYPQSKCGVVVLYNSANGREAAERIAHAALGGE